MRKNRLTINKALLEEDKLVLGFKNHQDKFFLTNELRKFSIRKNKVSRFIYFSMILFLGLGFWFDRYFYFALLIIFLYYIFKKFYQRSYKLILIERSGKKYTFTFDRKMRSIVFNIRLQVKYKLMVD